MKKDRIKYFSIIFMLSLFIFKGVATVLPLFADSFKITQKESNSASEKTEEGNTEKEPEKKELFALPFHDISSLRYAASGNSFIPPLCRFHGDVFLPINTPPPKHRC